VSTNTVQTTDERLHKLEIEMAERRPVDKLIQLFIYLLAALSIVVGIFGFKQFSDIGAVIATEVRTQFPRDQQRFLDYKKLIEDTAVLSTKHQELFGKYEAALKTFAHLDKVTDDFDLEGKVMRVMEVAEDGNKDILNDEQWRLQAVATLRLLAEAQKKRNFRSDFIFNAAQTASRLQQNALAYDLMQVAFTKRPNDAPIQAGRLSAIVEIGDEKEVKDAFAALMNMVVNLDANSPHIVLSEAWNAAEHLRRYDVLVAAVDRFVQSKDRVVKPSYAYFIKAYALTRASRPGDLAAAKLTMEEGLAILTVESPNAVWYEASLREYAKCLKVFAEFKQSSKLRRMQELLAKLDGQ
jgi:hypothetical protein